MIKLHKLTTEKLSTWVKEAKSQAVKGNIMQRIPFLALANPDWFAVHICCKSGETYTQGDTDCVFPLMSLIKPFSLLYLLEQVGVEEVLKWVGIEPSDQPFNSLEQLIADNGYPRNPMINSGAITLADKLPGKEPTQLFCQWLNKLAGCQLELDQKMLDSVRSTHSSANIAIAHHLHYNGHIKDINLALDIYEEICCISGKVADLALLGKLLACESNFVKLQNRQIVNALMLTCGLYEDSAKFAVKIGLPMKSGISGALLAIIPDQVAIACYSPNLDSTGNSVAGLALTQILSQELQLSIFS
ncbi:glutaminase [Cronbergia sp. UHCC 0137]|uniref:glutaminase n=1 Tax=Cronbergia sp. UHCC 0137 TaxID=3110239 RepID=UPI002B211B43|nr:glutaminase [Cronbergia sp. UHCC 0137]MEA5618481.1 glutaminase [Cronbergia sp. UHCC 0137]